MNFNVYVTRKNVRTKLDVLVAFISGETGKAYAIIDIQKKNDSGKDVLSAFAFDIKSSQQIPLIIEDRKDVRIIQEVYFDDILFKQNLLNDHISEEHKKDYVLDLKALKNEEFYIEPSNMKDGRNLFSDFKQNALPIEIEDTAEDKKEELIKRIDSKIHQLEQQMETEQKHEDLNEMIRNGDNDAVLAKVDLAFNVLFASDWIIEDLKKLYEYLDLKGEKFSKEKYEIKALNMILSSIQKNKTEITQDIQEALDILCEYSNDSRIKSVLNYIPHKEELAYNKLLYSVIMIKKNLYDSRYIRRIANNFYNNYDFSIALDLFKIALEVLDEGKDDYKSLLYNDVGCCLVEQQKISEAITAFKKATSYNSKNATAYNNWAYTLAVECDAIPKDENRIRKLQDAYTQINKAIVLDDSDDIEHYNNKVMISYELGRYDEVLDDCEKMLKKTQTFAEKKVFLIMRLLSKFELHQSGHTTSFDEIYVDLQEFYNNGKGDDKYYNKGMKIFTAFSDLYENTKDVSFNLSLLEFITNKIKEELLVRETTNDIAYYTSIGNLYYLLSDEEDEVKCRLPLFDVNHMNDPNEGIALYKYIFSNTNYFKYENICKNEYNEDGRMKLGENYTFLKSFSKVIDTLPMWVQYGDDGKGCCLRIDPKRFTKLNYQSKTLEKFFKSLPFQDDYKLYKVVYIDKDKILNVEFKELKRLLEIQIKLLDSIGKEIELWEERDKNSVLEVITQILSDIKYLFKDATYSHEEEIRIILYRKVGDINNPRCDLKYTQTKPIPKVYIYLSKTTPIKEVILGPKILDSNDYIPYISTQLQKFNETERIIPITKSTIDYR